MPTYLERYLAGEYETVWQELTALGSAVRQEPLYTDALAVARETMGRARENIAIIIARLPTLGYRFSYAGRDPSLSELLTELFQVDVGSAFDDDDVPFVPNIQHVHDEIPDVLAEPAKDTSRRLASIRAQYGELPLAIQAWYERVGAVNLVGSFPVENPLEDEGLNDLYQYRAAHAAVGLRDYRRPLYDLDPLWVYSLDHQMRHLKYRLTRTPPTLILAPCDFTKQGFWTCRPSYLMRLPNPGMDGIVLNERHHTTFVGYLRLCMRWAGFPGLELRQRQPVRELALLTEGLIPF